MESLLRHRFLLAGVQRDWATSDSKQSLEWDCSFLATLPSLTPTPSSFSIFLFHFVFDSLFLSWLTFPPLPYFYSLLILPHHWDWDVMLTQFQKWEEYKAARESTLGISFVSPLPVFLWRHLIACSDCEWSTYFRRHRSRSGFKTFH